MLLPDFYTFKKFFDFGNISLPNKSALLDFPIYNTIDLNQLILSVGIIAAIALAAFSIMSVIEVAKTNK